MTTPLLRRLVALTWVLAGLMWLPGIADARQLADLHVALSPNRPNASTTISFDFEIRTDSGALPAALTSLSLHLPKGMNIATSTLGLASCKASTLLEFGPEGCSQNSEVGFGTGFMAVPLGAKPAQETVHLTAFVGPPNNGNIVILFYANGESPIDAQLVFPGELLGDSGAFSGQLQTVLPLVPTVPEGPDVSVLSFASTIGPYGLLYHRNVGGHSIAYHPRGLNVPSACPVGGFPFAADFSFQDGTTTTALVHVPCPTRKAPARPRKRRHRAK